MEALLSERKQRLLNCAASNVYIKSFPRDPTICHPEAEGVHQPAMFINGRWAPGGVMAMVLFNRPGARTVVVIIAILCTFMRWGKSRGEEEGMKRVGHGYLWVMFLRERESLPRWAELY